MAHLVILSAAKDQSHCPALWWGTWCFAMLSMTQRKPMDQYAALINWVSPHLQRDGGGVVVDEHDGEEERIDAVEHAAVAGDQLAGVLGARFALDHRFGQVAQL